MEPLVSFGSLTPTSVAGIAVELEKQAKQASQKMLDDLADVIKKHFKNNDQKIEAVVEKGSAKYVIVDYVNKLKPTFLLISSRGLNIVQRNLIGSVSDYCSHNCEVPVYLIKLPHKS